MCLEYVSVASKDSSRFGCFRMISVLTTLMRCTSNTNQIGKAAIANVDGYAAVPAYAETARDFKSFERRTGALPEQQVTPLLAARPVFMLQSPKPRR